MIVLIIAGGAGTRLWPLSTPEFPKHLLKINGDQLSLLQSTYERAKKLADKVYIISEAGHIHHVKDQLPDLDKAAFIIEPERRGTSSCIVAALIEIAKNNDPDEPIAILSADHYVRDVNGFTHTFKIAEQASRKNKKIVLIGIEPDRPATGFGYIQKDSLADSRSFIFNVGSFMEKPDYKTAQKYLKSGNYLWNSGYFVGSINTFKDAIEKYNPKLYENYLKLAKATPKNYSDIYLGFENISIDYSLIEKVEDLLVLPASFDWLDLGSYSDLYRAVDVDETGNHTHGDKIELDQVNSSFVQNLEDKPLLVIGLDNIVVVNTPNGTLIVRKDLSQEVGNVSKRIGKPKNA